MGLLIISPKFSFSPVGKPLALHQTLDLEFIMTLGRFSNEQLATFLIISRSKTKVVKSDKITKTGNSATLSILFVVTVLSIKEILCPNAALVKFQRN